MTLEAARLQKLRNELAPLIGLRIVWFSLPSDALAGFEPSQIAVVVNTVLDALLPQITLLAADDEAGEKLRAVGISKAPREIGEREGFPDFVHSSGLRLELKGLFVDNANLQMKRPPTRREPSARLKENVTKDVVDPETDVLLVAAVQLQPVDDSVAPVIVDIGLFPMAEVVEARDKRLAESGGQWIGGVPMVVSLKGRRRLAGGFELGELDDFEKDTNFGKLQRIPYPPLQKFISKYRTL